MKELEGKTAVVTGAASGIGRAMARRFAAAHMNVALADLDSDELDTLAEELRGHDVGSIAVRTDVAHEADVQALAEAVDDAFGNVHLVCNNAGVGGAWGPLSQIQTKDWQRVLGVNLWGVIHGLSAFLPAMLAHGEEGHIVNTASVNGLTSSPFVAPYGASKHAVFGLSQTLFQEMALEGGRIGVSVLCPAAVDTNAWKSIYDASGNGDHGKARVSANLSAGMDPDEVATLVYSAIRDRRFYVFTHHEWLSEVFQDEANRILTQTNPALRGGASDA